MTELYKGFMLGLGLFLSLSLSIMIPFFYLVYKYKQWKDYQYSDELIEPFEKYKEQLLSKEKYEEIIEVEYILSELRKDNIVENVLSYYIIESPNNFMIDYRDNILSFKKQFKVVRKKA